MNYEGIDLLDTSGTPRTIVPPRDMIVWDDGLSKLDEPVIRKVLAIVDSKLPNGKVICEMESTFVRYGHCAEIPHTRRATKREFAMWIAKGKGEWKDKSGNYVYVQWDSYRETEADEPCNEKIMVRKWSDEEWHEPTIDYMGIEEST